MRDAARREPDRPRSGGRRDASAGPALGVLALQRVAGNRAVGQVLAREPAAADSKTPTIDLGDLGVIAVTSFSLADSRHPGKEITLSSLVGPHSAKLMRAATDSRPIPTAVLVVKGQRITLTGAVVSRYQSSEGAGQPSESWSLSSDSIEFAPE